MPVRYLCAMLRFSQLPAITGGKIVSSGKPKPAAIEHLLIDSRKLAVPAASLFFAIRGERHDGHGYIQELYGKGVRQFVVEENHPVTETGFGFLKDTISVLAVDNPVRALQAVAAWQRRRFQIPVVGVTGSNGKTIVKEWLATLLGKSYNVAKSPRSYNSQVGVPLSVWQINESHTLGVFEAGISKPGEMAHLEKVIQPTIGIFTNIGTAHDEGFESRQQKTAEKAKLFAHCEAVVYCQDHEEIHRYLAENLPPEVQRWTWTKNPTPGPSPSGRGASPQTYGAPFYHTSPEKWNLLKEFVRQNPKKPTNAERLLWQKLRKEQLLGFKFRRQHAIHDFMVDFVNLEKKLVVEVDGEIHEQQEEYDGYRTEILNLNGFKVIRFTNGEVIEEMAMVLDKIGTALQSEREPAPLPDGEGPGVGFTLPFTDAASVENVMHCITLMRNLGIADAEIQEQLNLLQPVSMRLELKQGIRGCYLIDDTYNNDLAGLQTALDFLDSQQQRAKKTVILSDMLESGEDEAMLYGKIAAMLRSKNVTRLIGIGEAVSRNAGVFDIEKILFSSTEDFLTQLPSPTGRGWDSPSLDGGGPGWGFFSNELILIKGARTFRFERIVRQLQQKTHGTVLEINLDAVAHNLNHFRSLLRPQTKIMAMVKAFAYGSGSAEIASLLQFHRVDYLAVAYADEGVLLRENGITLPIMVMNPSMETFRQLIDYQLEPEIYSPRILQELLDFLEENDHSARIHVKVETGMNRLGFEPQHIAELVQTLRQHPRLHVAAIFSHLAASENPQHHGFTLRQIARFETVSSEIAKPLGYQPMRHILNSAGITHYPDAQFDMVRLGIGLYGVGTNADEQMHLQTVGTLKTTVSQIKRVKAGETVGYGRRGNVLTDSTIATIAIGYADGFDRRFSLGKGKVWINGHLAPVIGSVCMDMTMLDITNIPAQEGDTVVVFGAELPVQQLAAWANTIPYEIMTGISERVKRVFFAG